MLLREACRGLWSIRMETPVGSWCNVWQESVPNAIVLHVSGEIDLATAPTLEQLLADLPAEVAVIVDLEGVAYLDLSGIRVIEGLYTRGVVHQRSVIVAGAPPQVRRILELVGLDRRIPLADTVPQALGLASSSRRRPIDRS